MNNVTNETRRFIIRYDCVEPAEEHMNFNEILTPLPNPDYQLYVTVMPEDLLDLGQHPTEMGYYAAATMIFDKRVRENPDMFDDTTEDGSVRMFMRIHSIERHPWHPADGTLPEDCNIIEEYNRKSSETMSDFIRRYLTEGGGSLTDNQIEYLIEYAHDEDYYTPEDIREDVRYIEKHRDGNSNGKERTDELHTMEPPVPGAD